jgi:uncharacterized protein YdeI (YjbR/CyaY-like superfamily)
MKPILFPTPADLRKWFEKHHATERELWAGFFKKGSGRPSVTWPESVDEALCVGWIDGIRKSVNERSYKIRFTPRKPHKKEETRLQRLGRLIEDSARGRRISPFTRVTPPSRPRRARP